MAPAEVQEATTRVDAFFDRVHVVSMVEAVKTRAKRLVGVHSFRAVDALQLGAALAAAYDDPLGSEFVCLDERLAAPARREGFTAVP